MTIWFAPVLILPPNCLYIYKSLFYLSSLSYHHHLVWCWYTTAFPLSVCANFTRAFQINNDIFDIPVIWQHDEARKSISIYLISTSRWDASQPPFHRKLRTNISAAVIVVVVTRLGTVKLPKHPLSLLITQGREAFHTGVGSRPSSWRERGKQRTNIDSAQSVSHCKCCLLGFILYSLRT